MGNIAVQATAGDDGLGAGGRGQDGQRRADAAGLPGPTRSAGAGWPVRCSPIRTIPTPFIQKLQISPVGGVEEGEELHIEVHQATVPGFGTFERCYYEIPKKAVRLDGTKAKVEDAWTLQQFYYGDVEPLPDPPMAFTFSVTADDGIAVASSSFTLYDDWNAYLNETEKHLNQWQIQADKWIGKVETESLEAFTLMNQYLRQDYTAFTMDVPTLAGMGFGVAAAAASGGTAGKLALMSIVSNVAGYVNRSPQIVSAQQFALAHKNGMDEVAENDPEGDSWHSLWNSRVS